VTSDLKSFASQQEIYLSNSFTYAGSVTALVDLTLSDRVTITVNESSQTGWAATGTHAGLTTQCGLFFGSASATAATPATVPGVVTCD
jgi:hypothetical protein